MRDDNGIVLLRIKLHVAHQFSLGFIRGYFIKDANDKLSMMNFIIFFIETK